MNKTGYLELLTRVRAKASREEVSQHGMLDLAIGLDSALRNAVPLTGTFDVGMTDSTGNFVSGSFRLVSNATTEIAVKATFKDTNNKVVLEPVLIYEITMNGADFDFISVAAGHRVFVAFDDRQNSVALQPAIEMIAVDLTKVVADFENR